MAEALAPEKESHVGCAGPKAGSPGAVWTRVPKGQRQGSGRKETLTADQHPRGQHKALEAWALASCSGGPMGTTLPPRPAACE